MSGARVAVRVPVAATYREVFFGAGLGRGLARSCGVGSAAHGVGSIAAELALFARQSEQSAARATCRWFRAALAGAGYRHACHVSGAGIPLRRVLATADRVVDQIACLAGCLARARRVGRAAHGFRSVVAELAVRTRQSLQPATRLTSGLV